MVENIAPTPTEAEVDIEVRTTETPLVEDELLIEDVSIDGMCGVY